MIYIVRRHNDFEKIRDVTIGAFSTTTKCLDGIRSDMLENGYFDEAMQIDMNANCDFIHRPSGLRLSAIRFAFGPNPFGQYYEVKLMSLDGE